MVDEIVLTKEGLINLLKKDLWNLSKECDGEIYEGVYDIIHNGTENGLTLEDSDFEKVADDIIYKYGVYVNGDADEMTINEIEAELGRKIRIKA